MAKRSIAQSTRSRKPAVRIIFAPLAGRLGLGAGLGRGKAEGRVVYVDPRKPWPAHTLLHELLHVRHPSWSETRIRRATAARWKRMGWRERAALLQMFGSARLGDDE